MQESHFYVDVLTKGGDICEINEDGTFAIVSDGSDDEDEDEDSDQDNIERVDEQQAGQEDMNDTQVVDQMMSNLAHQSKNSQFNQTQGKQHSPK